MSKKVLTRVDFGGIAPINQVLERLAAAPAAPRDGRVYFDTTSGQMRIWTGAVWLDLPGEDEGVTYSAGDGIDIVADTIGVRLDAESGLRFEDGKLRLDIQSSNSGLELNAGQLRVLGSVRGALAQGVGDGTGTSFVVTHGFNTRNVIVQVYESAPPYALVDTDVELSSANGVTVYFDAPPSVNQYQVIVRA
mgnify:FL=1